MLNTSRKESIRAAGYKAVLATLLLAAGGAASAANVAVTLCAKAGVSAAPAVPVWGYAPGACASAAAPAAPGGPVIDVNVDDVVTVTLDNSLLETTGLTFQGQGMVSDTTGAGAGATKSYTFTASKAGTYLYQAAPLPNAQHQVAMGLYGALVVRSATVDTLVHTDTAAIPTAGSAVVPDPGALDTDVGLVVSGTGIPAGAKVTAVSAGVSFTMDQAATAGDGLTLVSVDFISRKGAAYGASSAYDEEAIIVLSEIDAGLNSSANPAAFDMRDYGSNALGRNGVPMYYLINGKSYPDTLPIASTAGHTLLIRYVNAGARHHSMGLLGLRQRFIAKDGNPLPTGDVALTAETLAPGQTGDALVTIPAVTTNSQFALYDASLNLQNRDGTASFGGMLTFVSAGTGTPTSGPTTKGVIVSPAKTTGAAPVTLAAAVTSSDAGGVTAVEYFIDTKGADGSGTSMAVATAPNYSATIDVATLAGMASGSHTFYVHGQDVNGWGGHSFAVLNLDKTGPVTSALTLTPNPSQPGATVVLHASASDAGTGGLNITGAQYSLNGTTWTAATLEGVPAPDRSMNASFTAPASSTTVHVRSVDELGNVGAEATLLLTVSAGGPTTTINTVSPNPANGVQGFNSSTPAVRVIATMTSASATIAGGEAFISACATGCAQGTGIPLVASDGSFNGTPETGYADIPLATIAGLVNGTYTISVHGRDSAGNWGAFAAGTLVVNHSAPRVTNVRLNPAYTNAAAVSVIANVTDAGTGGNGIAGGEYFIDTIGAPGSGTTMTRASAASTTTISATISAATVSGLSEGTHTVFVRARDSAAGGGNWSAVLGAALIIDRTRPNFLGITANGPSPTNANSVVYTVTFSEAVTGISSGDFQVTETLPGNLSVNVSGTGSTRTVTISTGNGSASGTIRLSLRSNATITDLAGNNWQNPNSVSLNGPTYTIDKSGPSYSMSLSPSTVAPGTASVTMNISGASDASGIAEAVWWIGGNNPPANGGAPFTVSAGGAASVTIPTDTLAAGTYTVRALMTDTLGNSTAHSSTLRVAIPGPTVGAAFAGSVRRTGTAAQRTTTYTITFTNPNAVAISGLALTDLLPQPSGGFTTSLTIPSNPVSSCGGNASRILLNRAFQLSNGTIPANGSCTLTMSVVLSNGAGSSAGYTLTDTIAAGDVTTSNAASNASDVSASLTVVGP